VRLARDLPLIASVKKSNVPESVPAPNSFSGTSGKPGANVAPVVDLRSRLPDLLELGDREAPRPRVLLVDDDA